MHAREKERLVPREGRERVVSFFKVLQVGFAIHLRVRGVPRCASRAIPLHVRCSVASLLDGLALRGSPADAQHPAAGPQVAPLRLSRPQPAMRPPKGQEEGTNSKEPTQDYV